jgi:hypothetical protein
MADLSELQIERELLWRKCKGSSAEDFEACLYFLDNYWKIRHPSKGTISFPIRERPAQMETLETVMSCTQSIILKARQIGFTTLFTAYMFWLAFFWPDKLVIVLSKREDDAKDILKFVVRGYDRLPEWIRDRGPKRTNDSSQIFSLSNESEIKSFPSNNNPARGQAAYLVVFDEFAFLEDQHSAWASVEPTTDIGGRVIILSTANGGGSLYESMFNAALGGHGEMEAIFYPWSAVPDRDMAWYEAKIEGFRRANAEWIMHQEYPTSPEEAFIRSGRAVFDLDLVIERREAIIRGSDDIPVSAKGYIAPKGGGEAKLARHFVWRQGQGEFEVWRQPDKAHRYVMGVDVSEGLEHGDFSVCSVYDTKTKEKVAKWRGHIDPDLLAKDIAWPLGHFYGGALIGVESNNHGLVTLIKLRDLAYPRLFRRQDRAALGRPTSTKLGWYTSKSSKVEMIDEFQEAFREELVIYDTGVLAEMLMYTRDEKGRMSGSPFDDEVMADAIANQMFRHMHTVSWPEVESDAYTFGWLVRRDKERVKRDANVGMGRRLGVR